MKTKITPQERMRLSVLLKLDEAVLQDLDKLGLLDSTKSRSYLIQAEYKQITGQSKQLKQYIVMQLARKYKMSISAIEVIIYSKTVNKHCSCKVCQAKITKYKSTKNGGICDDCKPI
ncbi:hypothetical protein [Dysgonomonas sp. GY617]|uniref:hypothetical protein n=1 Tax=Dysgonomonas sp. GY617 TaxID=2780420 RepID=UPI0018836BDB|nr:hypothetical protein [Dysgonomonas sp. GY617]MBF0578175.1 hypothetical protein [Dysgonomonas sp. GY617]